MISTELILENTLTDLPPEEIAAVLSCLIFELKTDSEPRLTDSLQAVCIPFTPSYAMTNSYFFLLGIDEEKDIVFDGEAVTNAAGYGTGSQYEGLYEKRQLWSR